MKKKIFASSLLLLAFLSANLLPLNVAQAAVQKKIVYVAKKPKKKKVVKKKIVVKKLSIVAKPKPVTAVVPKPIATPVPTPTPVPVTTTVTPTQQAPSNYVPTPTTRVS